MGGRSACNEELTGDTHPSIAAARRKTRVRMANVYDANRLQVSSQVVKMW